MSRRRPESLRVRMYNVGFGDSFLITVRYTKPNADGRRDHHMLVDLGSTRRPKTRQSINQVAKHIDATIRAETGGKLDVLVVTHRHRDHLGGFGSDKTAAVIDGLDPQLIVRPWTDDPTLTSDAGQTSLDPTSLRFAQDLHGARRLLEAVQARFAAAASRSSTSWAARVKQLADMQVANAQAIATLDEMSVVRKAKYVQSGDKLDLRSAMPGVSVEILGPPTLRQAPGITTQRADDPDQFWLKGVRAADEIANLGANGKRLFDDGVFASVAGPGGLEAARFLLDRIDGQSTQRIFQIAEGFDDAINNTSIVMILTVGDKSVLLTGDAQWENWEYTLGRADRNDGLRQRLADVDVYKVGHHGSRNATPKSLFGLWADGQRTNPRTLHSMLSTTSGFHGHTAHTAVPKGTLVEALRGGDDLRWELHSTEERLTRTGEVAIDLQADVDGGPFTSSTVMRV